MSQEDVEMVRAILAHFAAGEWDEALERFWGPATVIDATRNVFNPDTYVGTEGARRMLARLEEAWAEIRLSEVDLIDAGNCVVAISRMIGKGSLSGVQVERFNGQIWALENGRVIRLEIGFIARGDVLAAAGIPDAQ